MKGSNWKASVVVFQDFSVCGKTKSKATGDLRHQKKVQELWGTALPSAGTELGTTRNCALKKTVSCCLTDFFWIQGAFKINTVQSEISDYIISFSFLMDTICKVPVPTLYPLAWRRDSTNFQPLLDKVGFVQDFLNYYQSSEPHTFHLLLLSQPFKIESGLGDSVFCTECFF